MTNKYTNSSGIPIGIPGNSWGTPIGIPGGPLGIPGNSWEFLWEFLSFAPRERRLLSLSGSAAASQSVLRSLERAVEHDPPRARCGPTRLASLSAEISINNGFQNYTNTFQDCTNSSYIDPPKKKVMRSQDCTKSSSRLVG